MESTGGYWIPRPGGGQNGVSRSNGIGRGDLCRSADETLCLQFLLLVFERRTTEGLDMSAWSFGRKKSQEMPQYSALQSIPSRSLPSELTKEETSQFYLTQREALQQQLLEPARRPAEESPLFVELLSGDKGVVTVNLPDGQCLPIFSTPFRAADYRRTQLASGSPVQYLSTSPRQVVGMLRDLERLGIKSLVLDRCPRCSILTIVQSVSIKTSDDAIGWWAIIKATELSRANLYLTYALHACRAGWLVLAREVALETVGHVTLEDPRLHLLLGQIGLGLGDRTLLHEAGEFLGFLRADAWSRKLEQAVRTGSPDFADFVQFVGDS
jgi:hypothetical protein